MTETGVQRKMLHLDRIQAGTGSLEEQYFCRPVCVNLLFYFVQFFMKHQGGFFYIETKTLGSSVAVHVQMCLHYLCLCLGTYFCASGFFVDM